MRHCRLIYCRYKMGGFIVFDKTIMRIFITKSSLICHKYINYSKTKKNKNIKLCNQNRDIGKAMMINPIKEQ